MTESSIPLVVRRLIPAPRELIFDAFTSVDALASWFTPSTEIRLEIREFSFEIGGHFRFRYHMPGDRHPTVCGTYEIIERPSHIVFSWVWQPPDPLENIPMRVQFAFDEKSDGTEVVVTHEQIPSDHACTIHQDGWEAALNSLETFLRTRTKPARSNQDIQNA